MRKRTMSSVPPLESRLRKRVVWVSGNARKNRRHRLRMLVARRCRHPPYASYKFPVTTAQALLFKHRLPALQEKRALEFGHVRQRAVEPVASGECGSVCANTRGSRDGCFRMPLSVAIKKRGPGEILAAGLSMVGQRRPFPFHPYAMTQAAQVAIVLALGQLA